MADYSKKHTEIRELNSDHFQSIFSLLRWIRFIKHQASSMECYLKVILAQLILINNSKNSFSEEREKLLWKFIKEERISWHVAKVIAEYSCTRIFSRQKLQRYFVHSRRELSNFPQVWEGKKFQLSFRLAVANELFRDGWKDERWRSDEMKRDSQQASWSTGASSCWLEHWSNFGLAESGLTIQNILVVIRFICGWPPRAMSNILEINVLLQRAQRGPEEERKARCGEKRSDRRKIGSTVETIALPWRTVDYCR